MQRIRSARPPRTGLHLSSLIGCTRKAWQARHRGEGEETESDEFTLTVTLGKGLHNIFESAKETTYEVAGIHFTPDEILETDEGRVVVEFKTTRSSSAKEIWEQETYVEQAAGYCSLLGINKARIVVVHMIGTATDPTVAFKQKSTKPVLKVWDIEFENWELSSWMEEILYRANVVETAPSLGSVPIEMHRTWECKYCPLHKVECDGGKGERKFAFPKIDN